MAPPRTKRAALVRYPPPPPLTRLWVRTLISFAVTVAIGLAPFLGTMGVPLFSPLLNLIPLQIRTEAITLSTMAMSLVAIAVQWKAKIRSNPKEMRKKFRVAITSTVFTFVCVFAISNFLVVRVHFLAGSKSVTFLKGFRRPSPDPCAGLSDEACIQRVLTFNEADINSYWGDNQIAVSRFLFLSAYIAMLAQFGLLIGYLVQAEAGMTRAPGT